MQAEDKFTKDTDPVDTAQKRMERAQEKWREEHAEEIKDDMKEYAERCLANERAGQGGDAATPAAPSKSPAEEDRPDAKASDTAEADEEPTTHSGKEVDNRKLVYEDIWDDVPPLAPRGAAEVTPTDGPGLGQSSSVKDFQPSATFDGAREGFVFKKGFAGMGYYREAAPASDRAGPASAESAPEPAKAAPEVFMPWATGAAGAGGLDDLPVPTAAVERRMAELKKQRQQSQETPESKAKEAEAAAGGKTWYSKYAEKVQEVEANVEKAKAFAPPPRRPGGAGITEVTPQAAPSATPASAPASTPAPPAAVAASAAVATTSAAAHAEGEDGGELDEMD